MVPTAGQQLETRSWSTGDIDRNRETNTSHAERYFVSFVTAQPPEWQERITRIEAQLFGYSPCERCAEQLAPLLGNLNKKREHLKQPTIDASLTWEGKPYPGGAGGVNATKQEDLNKLAEAGWKVEPSSIPKVGEDEYEPKP